MFYELYNIYIKVGIEDKIRIRINMNRKFDI